MIIELLSFQKNTPAGASSLVSRFCDGVCRPESIEHITGKYRTLKIQGQDHKYQICHKPKKSKSFGYKYSTRFTSDRVALVLVVDITQPMSFKDIEMAIQHYSKYYSRATLYLMLNKCDLLANPNVSAQDQQALRHNLVMLMSIAEKHAAISKAFRVSAVAAKVASQRDVPLWEHIETVFRKIYQDLALRRSGSYIRQNAFLPVNSCTPCNAIFPANPVHWRPITTQSGPINLSLMQLWPECPSQFDAIEYQLVSSELATIRDQAAESPTRGEEYVSPIPAAEAIAQTQISQPPAALPGPAPAPTPQPEEKPRCAVCLAPTPPSHLFLDCGHLCVCKQCGEQCMQTTRKCPICRKPATRIIQVFQS